MISNWAYGYDPYNHVESLIFEHGQWFSVKKSDTVKYLDTSRNCD